MKKKLLLILLASTVACSLFAGCSEKKDDSPKRSTKKTTVVEKESEDYDDDDSFDYDDDNDNNDDSESTLVDGKFKTAKDYVNYPAVKSSLDSTCEQMAGSGLSATYSATDDTLTFTYTSDNQLVGTTFTTVDEAAAAIEDNMSSQESYMQSLCNQLGQYIDQDYITITCEYYDADGTFLTSLVYISE